MRITAVLLSLVSSLASGADAPAVKVSVVKPVKATVWRYVDVPGGVEAYQSADLYAKVSGYVTKIGAEIGDRVKSGQVLAEIGVPEMLKDLAEVKATVAAREAGVRAAEAAVKAAELGPGVARTNLARAREVLKFKEITLKRKEELFEQKAITDQDLDEVRNAVVLAKADVEVAEAKIAAVEADLASAKANQGTAEAQLEVAKATAEKSATLLEYAKIVAPFDGVVTRRMVDVGTLTQAGAGKGWTMFTVQQIDKVRVVADVPESDVMKIKIGGKVNVKLYGAAAPIEGQVTRTSSSLNTVTRTMRTEIDLANAEGKLLPGMYAVVSLAVEQHADALTVPSTAVLVEGKDRSVFIVQDGKAMKKPVSLGYEDGGKSEVLKGLAGDEAVITVPKGLSDKAAVEVAP